MWRSPVLVGIFECTKVASSHDTFLNMYGFFRNIAVVALLSACILAGAGWLAHGPKEYFYWAAVAMVCSIGMLYRYLKFLRHYGSEIFTSYAYPGDTN
jgi:hypothetical protein